MATANGDRNLLFGILALQMDFIGRDALVLAMNAWVLDKAKPLGQILVEQGALSAARCALLEPLVQEHVKQHGDDAGKSLASVSSVGSAREVLQQIADADVQASLAHVRPAADSYATNPPSVGAPSTVGRRFRVLRPHAEGGLGKVSVAQDEELHREVALKEIQERHADHPESRARFLVEAEITGGLEHPGIVPVYGLGQYADGRPFYAMRFIRGDSLKEAIEHFHKPEAKRRPAGERALELRKLLGRFVDVCEAIAYAHSRGVLHRDLKPGNIMLGKYGETLVVDWGLAKPVGDPAGKEGEAEEPLRPASADDSAPTQMGSAVGTPQFMPPEQAAGRLDHLGPASDVYSLGATLYCLLTGKAPFEGADVGAVLQRVQRGDFPPPRQLKRDVPPALEAICLKAMALRPEDRYQTPRALAGDVEKWLAEEPVSVYRERLTERVVRWARRRPSAAAFLALFITALLAGMAVSTFFAVTSNANYLDARKREKDTNNALVQVTEEKKQVSEANTHVDATNKRLEVTLARSLLRPLGPQADKITDPEIEALWELAQSNDCVRLLFVEQALQKPMTAEQLRSRADMAIHAAAGLDLVQRCKVEDLLLARLRDEQSDFNVRTSCVFIGVALEDWRPEFAGAAARQAVDAIAKTNNSDAQRALAEAVAALAPRMEPADAARQASAAARLIVVAMQKTTDNDALSALAKAVAALAPRMELADTSTAARQVVDEMGKGLTNFYALNELARALAALAPRLEPSQASAAAQQILEVMGKTLKKDALETLSKALMELAPRLKPSDASAAGRLAVDTMEKTHYLFVPDAMANVLAALAPRMESGDASAIARQAVDATGTSTVQEAEAPLAKVVAVLAPRMEPGEASAAAGQALDAMGKTTDPFAVKALAEAVAALAPRMEPGEAARNISAAARLVVQAMEKTTDLYPVRILASAVDALAPRMEPADATRQASAAARLVVQAMQKATDNDALSALGKNEELSALARTVAALVPRMEPTDGARQASAATRVVLKAMQKETNSRELSTLARTVAALAPRMEPDDSARQASESVRLVVQAIKKKPDDSYEQQALSEALASLAPMALGNASAARQDLESMGMMTDFSARSILGKAVAALGPRLEPGDVSVVARQAVEAMGKPTNSLGISDWAEAVARLAPEMKSSDALAAAQRVLDELGHAIIPEEVDEMVAALAALAARMEPGDVPAVARHVVAAMGKDTEGFQRLKLAKALAALEPRLEPGDASVVARQAVEAMENPPMDFSERDLAEVAAAQAPWLKPEDAWATARQVLETMGKTTFGLEALSGDLAALAVQPGPQEASERSRLLALAIGHSTLSQSAMISLAPLVEATQPPLGRFTEQQLVDLLKMPTCQQPPRQMIVRQLGWQCGQTFANQWEFVEWARQHPERHLDLTSPPTRP